MGKWLYGVRINHYIVVLPIANFPGGGGGGGVGGGCNHSLAVATLLFLVSLSSQ